MYTQTRLKEEKVLRAKIPTQNVLKRQILTHSFAKGGFDKLMF